jgi:hypothetical protein
MLLLLGSCKKNDDESPLVQLINYSYGSFNVSNATATTELNDRYLSITLGSPSSTIEQGGVNIQLHNYTGPGEYQFSDCCRRPGWSGGILGKLLLPELK